jgi:cellulose synthase/poly-beta-1,6-N-acetylglucosamine synthase-like glycosyltransferase
MSIDSLCFWLAAVALLPLVIKNVYIVFCMVAARLWELAPEVEQRKAPLRFAFLIPAHNESSVVGACVTSIRLQAWPEQAVGIYVVADNCTDSTAEVARAAGAMVFERSTVEISGKAKAVRHGIEQIKQGSEPFDYLVIVDADNVLADDWTSEVAFRLRGDDGFQTYVETKNPQDSAVTFGNYLSFVFMNRVVQEGRSRVGLPALLAGTGMGFSRSFLEREGFASDSLTEDRDLSMQALEHGTRFRWIGSAVLFDEKPVGAKASFNQYKRWSSGQLAGLADDGRRLISLLGRGKLIRAFDMLYTMTGPLLPFSYLAALLFSIACLVAGGDPRPLVGFMALSLASVILLALMLAIFGRGLKDVLGLRSYIYVRLISWASLLAACIRKDKKWVKTRHERGISAADLDQIRKGKF